MQTAIEILQSSGLFLAGAFARLGIFFVMLAVLVVPALALALVLRAIGVHREKLLGLRRVSGILFRPDAFYAPGHVWLRERGGRKLAGALELGVDDLAQRLLPSVTSVELAHAGAAVAKGETVAVLHGGGRAVRIAAPIAGTIAGVNAAVLRDPALVKREGYGRGWLVAIAPEDRSYEKLPHGPGAEGWLSRESSRWSRFLEDRLGFAAADGGELLAPAPWLVGEDNWKALTAEFLNA